jgi:heme A synthase
MPHQRSFVVASRLARVTASFMFALIVIGSVVRTTGSGLACPDWPLCHGQLIPPFQFNILMEWLHRLVALIVSLLLFATVGFVAARGELRPRLGGFALLAVGLLAVQVLLGALTVWQLLHPAVVSSHLGVGLLLFATLLTIGSVAHAAAEGDGALPARAPGLLPWFAGATALVYAQALLGGAVSTSGASLACPDWPTCNGQWLPAFSGLIGLQTVHRLGAYTVTLVMVALALRARAVADPRLRAGARLALALTLAQVAIGVGNVFMRVPVWMSALHLANAAALMALMLTLTLRLVRSPARRLQLVPLEAR